MNCDNTNIMKDNNFIIVNSNFQGNPSTLAEENRATVLGVSSVSRIDSLSTGINSKTEGIYSCEMKVLSWYTDKKNENSTSCISEIENNLTQTAGIYFVSPNKYRIYLPVSIVFQGEETACFCIRDILRKNPHNYVYENVQIDDSIGNNSKTTSEKL